jgi:hypothetical protein
MVFTTKLACIAYAMLASLPPWYEDVNEEGRNERLTVIAESEAAGVGRAMAPTCGDPTPFCRPYWSGDAVVLVAGVTAEGFWESRFSRHVHEGRCKPWECDAWKRRDGTVLHRSRSSWQIQGWHRDWGAMLGADLEPTTRAAGAAAQLVAVGLNTCGSKLGAVTRYAGLGGCSWAGGTGRVRTWEQLEKVGRAAQADCE